MRSFTSFSCAMLLAVTSLLADSAIAFPTGSRGAQTPSFTPVPASGPVAAGGSGGGGGGGGAALSGLAGPVGELLDGLLGLVSQQLETSGASTGGGSVESDSASDSGSVGSLRARSFGDMSSFNMGDLESFLRLFFPFLPTSGSLTGDGAQGGSRPTPSSSAPAVPAESARPEGGDIPGTDMPDGADPVPGADGILGERSFGGFPNGLPGGLFSGTGGASAGGGLGAGGLPGGGGIIGTNGNPTAGGAAGSGSGSGGLLGGATGSSLNGLLNGLLSGLGLRRRAIENVGAVKRAPQTASTDDLVGDLVDEVLGLLDDLLSGGGGGVL